MTSPRLKFTLCSTLSYLFLICVQSVFAQVTIKPPASNSISQISQISEIPDTLIINSSKLEYYPIEFTKIFVTEDDELSLDDINFIDNKYWKNLTPDFDYNVDSVYWLKLNLKLDTADKQAQILEWIITPGFWFKASIFLKNQAQNNLSDDNDWHEYDLSVFTPLADRMIKHNTPAIDLFKGANQQQLLIKLRGFRHGRTSEFRSIKILSLKKLRYEDQKELHFQGIYLGIALALVGFHFVLWLWFREKSYFWLVLMGAVSPVFFHALYGFGLTHLWSDFVIWNEYSANLLAIITASFYLRFSAAYLNLDIQYPKINLTITIGIMVSLFLSLSVFYDLVFITKLAPLLQTALTLLILCVSVKLSIKGHRHAWYFVTGNTLILLSLMLWSLSEIEFMSVEFLPVSVAHLTQVAASIQGVLLALGMVDRMQSMRQVLLETQLQKEKQEKQQVKKTQHLMKIQNAELASTNYALKEVDQLKDEFLAKTSHEINTPLNGILGLSEVLINDNDQFTTEERKEYLELIYSRGEHLRDLVVELLEFTKTKRDVVKLYPESFDVVSHIQKIILSFESIAEKKGLELKFSGNQEVLVFADVRRFRQVISILIDNAIKYTDSGTIELSVKNEDDVSIIHVKDSGIGIAKENVESIFEAFKQVKDSKKTREGAGLGLAICKHLVELHHGKINVQSILGKGTIFSIELPANDSFSLE